MTDYLYHYTSVESLASILKSRSFRFSPLSVLDDLQEEKVRDWQKFGNYVFVSSWTNDNKESIPMWNMYSNMTSGIRIKMKLNPFKKYDVDISLLKQEFPDISISPKFPTGYKFTFPAKNPVGYTTEFTIDKLIIPNKDFFLKDYYLFNCAPENLLFKVEYTDDDNLLIPHIEKVSSITLGKLGKHKKTCWDFQKEWRYILCFAPIGFNKIANFPICSMHETYNTYSNPLNTLPFKYYFLKLDDDAFENMEITLSPKISDGYRTVVDLLKKEYNPHMSIYESDLNNIIR